MKIDSAHDSQRPEDTALGNRPLRQLLHAATGDRAAEAAVLADEADVNDTDARDAVRRVHGDLGTEAAPVDHDVATPRDARHEHPDTATKSRLNLDPDVIRLAEGPNLATVVTLMPDGQPQALLTWVDTDGEHVLVNTEPQRQRAKNVQRDPRITVLIHSSESAWDWAEIRGRVVGVVDGPEARAHIDALSRKYLGTDYANPIGPDGRIILQIVADKVNTPASIGH